MKVFRADAHECTFWLAAERYLTEHCDEEAFLLWTVDPTVVIGRFQNIRREVDEAFIRDNRIRLVRRYSGGGAVYQDRGTLQFSYWLPGRTQAESSFADASRPVLEALLDMGLNATFSGRNDILADGYKVAGLARYVTPRGIIHHGTMLFSANKDNLARALTPDTAKLTAKGIESVRSRIVNIRDLLSEPMTAEEFYDRIMEKNAEIVDFDETALNIISENKAQLDSWDWVYGENPQFAHARTARFAGGSVTAQVEVLHGVLQNVWLEGDFFAEGNVDAFLAALKNVRYDRASVDAALREAKIDANALLRGISADELFSVIL